MGAALAVAVATRAGSRRATARCWRPAWRWRTRRGCRACVFQAAHTAAPWSSRPTPLSLLAIPGVLFGFVAVPLLALGAGAALRRARPPEGARLLALIGGVAALLAFLGSQLEPAWAPRYLAILFGPLLLALAAVLARGRALDVAGAARRRRRLAHVRAGAGQEQRADGRRARSMPELRPGDLVVCTQPEQVPVLAPLPAARPALPDAARARRASRR